LQQASAEAAQCALRCAALPCLRATCGPAHLILAVHVLAGAQLGLDARDIAVLRRVDEPKTVAVAAAQAVHGGVSAPGAARLGKDQ
jgi:hypothetical protein